VVPDTTASLSRRQVLGAGGAVLAATLGARFLPQSTGDDTTRVEWPMTQRDPGATGYTPTSSGPVKDATIRWKQPLDTGFPAYSVPSPVVADGVVYAIGQELLAVDADSGDVRFRRPYAADVAPAVEHARAYRTPTVAIHSADGVTALHGHGGHEVGGQSVATTRWTGPSGQDDDLLDGGGSGVPPVAADGIVLAYTDDSLTAFDASSGRVRWREATAFTRPAVHDGVAYVGVGPGYAIGAIDLETGAVERFELADGFVRAVTATETGLVVGTDDALLGVAFDGSVDWRFDDDAYSSWGDTRVAVVDGIAYTGIDTADSSSLVAIDTADGSLEWESSISVEHADSFEPPAVTDDAVYVPTNGGPLVGIERTTGDLAWQFQDGETRSWSTVALANDALYAVSDGTLYALEEP